MAGNRRSTRGGCFTTVADTVSIGFARAVCKFGEMLGDMNCDDVVDRLDIDPFVLALTDPSGYESEYPACDIGSGDMNGDGAVNLFDIDPFVEALGGP